MLTRKRECTVCILHLQAPNFLHLKGTEYSYRQTCELEFEFERRECVPHLDGTWQRSPSEEECSIRHSRGENTVGRPLLPDRIITIAYDHTLQLPTSRKYSFSPSSCRPLAPVAQPEPHNWD
jgi:hypothetical protein